VAPLAGPVQKLLRPAPADESQASTEALEGYNDDLVPVMRTREASRSKEGASGKYFCGRFLPRDPVLSLDVPCGPKHQCASCRRFQEWWDRCVGEHLESLEPYGVAAAEPLHQSFPSRAREGDDATEIEPHAGRVSASTEACEIGGVALTFRAAGGEPRTAVFGGAGAEQSLGLRFAPGPPCVVTSVAPDSRAEALGIQAGWALIEVSGMNVSDANAGRVYTLLRLALEGGRREPAARRAGLGVLVPPSSLH